MIRTQIYLTEHETLAMERLATTLGQGKSALIRQAVDEFIKRRNVTRMLKTLRAARGMWSDRKDLSDLQKSRATFDRF